MRRLPGLLVLFAVTAFGQDAHRYALILNEPAALHARQIGGKAAEESARARIINAQQAVKRDLSARGVRVTGSAHTFLNAVFVSVAPGDAAQLASIPGVAHVARLQRFHLNLDRAEQLTSVPAAWNLLGGVSNAGSGVKIGVIDTGIDATHPAFRDAALIAPQGFPICRVTYLSVNTLTPLDCSASDRTKGFPLCSAAGCQFTNSKVIVARSYVPLLSTGLAATSKPDDPSPRDRVGHGTAVAMAVAGGTSTGPADTITGVAPKAWLGSYKVFGSPGLNEFTSGDVVIQALEDAYADGMDIVVMSLGAPALSGPLDTGRVCGLAGSQVCDAEAYVVQQAVNAGMVVVAAAGNGGQTGLLAGSALGTIDSPGDAPSAIAVAATTNSHSWGNDLTVNGLGTYHSRLGDGPAPSSVISGPLGDVRTVGDPLACTAPPAGSLTGLVVLVQRGTCTFATKVGNIQAAGGIGVIVTNSAGDDTLVTPSGLHGTTVPSVFIGYSDGTAIRGYLASNAKTTVSLSPVFTPFDITTFNQVAPFSSHGPALGTSSLKPDIAAPGVDLYLAGQRYDPNGALFTSSGFLVSQGTSFSAPQVAGIAALVKQANPNLSAIQIRSSLVTTATQDVTENGATASMLAVGAGKANAANAVASRLSINPASISFGTLNGATLPLTQQIQITNTGTSALNLNISLVRRTPESTARTSIDLPNISINAGQTGSISLMLSGTIPAPGIYEGFVSIQGASTPVNIPWLYVVGDGVVANLLSLAGNGDAGTAGQRTAGGYVILQATDRFGVPVANLPVTFVAGSGGGRLTPIANTTDNYGIGAASVVLGSSPGTNLFTAAAGGLAVNFQATGVAQPVITPGGIVTAGTYSTQPPAPGSYISIFGNFLANSSSSYSTPYLPVSLNQVSVSFDNPNVSAPGHIVFVSPGQINVQIPWELQGQPSVQVKVTVGDSSSAVYTMPLGSYSPELYQIPSAGQNVAAALDEANNVVTPANPAARGHVVQLFANGLGAVTNQPASGDPAPSKPLSETADIPVVTIGGVTAPIVFHGMTPGNAALYQINAIVPETSAGLQPITVSIGGVISPLSSLPVK